MLLKSSEFRSPIDVAIPSIHIAIPSIHIAVTSIHNNTVLWIMHPIHFVIISLEATICPVYCLELLKESQIFLPQP